jgi:hypothetical protein
MLSLYIFLVQYFWTLLSAFHFCCLFFKDFQVFFFCFMNAACEKNNRVSFLYWVINGSYFSLFSYFFLHCVYFLQIALFSVLLVLICYSFKCLPVLGCVHILKSRALRSHVEAWRSMHEQWSHQQCPNVRPSVLANQIAQKRCLISIQGSLSRRWASENAGGREWGFP